MIYLKQILQVFSCEQTLNDIGSVEAVDAVRPEDALLLVQRIATSCLQVETAYVTYVFHSTDMIVLEPLGQHSIQRTEERHQLTLRC